MESIDSRNVKLLQQCLDHGASPNRILNEENGDSKIINYKNILAILHILSKSGDFKMIENLISTELNINITNKYQETPLVKCFLIFNIIFIDRLSQSLTDSLKFQNC
jgi:hypothetical protein